MVRISVTLTIFLAAFIVTCGFAAEKAGIIPVPKSTQSTSGPEKAADDPLGRSTPQGAVLGFIKSATQGDYDLALQYLDTKTRGVGARKLIVALRAVLDRGFSGKLATLSKQPEGSLEDSLPGFGYPEKYHK